MGFSLGKIVKKAGGLVKNLTSSAAKSVTSIARGDILGSLTNAANMSTLGIADFTGGNKGIVNLNSKKHLALGASGVGALSVAKTGLVSQLRKGKGNVGGGSYSEIVKNPLGGTAGKIGR